MGKSNLVYQEFYPDKEYEYNSYYSNGDPKPIELQRKELNRLEYTTYKEELLVVGNLGHGYWNEKNNSWVNYIPERCLCRMDIL